MAASAPSSGGPKPEIKVEVKTESGGGNTPNFPEIFEGLAPAALQLIDAGCHAKLMTGGATPAQIEEALLHALTREAIPFENPIEEVALLTGHHVRDGAKAKVILPKFFPAMKTMTGRLPDKEGTLYIISDSTCSLMYPIKDGAHTMENVRPNGRTFSFSRQGNP
jgi:hypothetical protein